MLINETGLVRAIKRAYKSVGYTVSNQGGKVSVHTETWYIQTRRDILPRKVLGIIAEHMGMIPDETAPIFVSKDTEPQVVIAEIAAEELTHWRSGKRGESAGMVPVIMQGLQILQTDSRACWGVPLFSLGMIQRGEAENTRATVVDDDRLLWESDTEAIVIHSYRKARSGWSRAWERIVWEALEGVDLHKEDE